MNFHSTFHYDDANLLLFTSYTLHWEVVIQQSQYSCFYGG